MAQIKGLTLKGLTRFVGREGEAYQGSIYLNGKKIGWFSQSGDGGCSDIDYESREIKAEVEGIVKKYFEENPPDSEYGGNDEDFFEQLVELCLDEKDFKKAVKKGFSWVVKVSNSFKSHLEGKPIPVPKVYSIPANLINDKAMEKFYAEMKAAGYDEITTYKSLDDFNVK